MVTDSAQRPPQAYASLLIGICAVSLGAIFIRLAQAEGTPSLLVAAARLAIAALVLTPLMLRGYRHDLQKLTLRQRGLILLSGLFLALHFVTWIASLEFVGVLISVALVNSAPLWSAILESLLLQTRINRLVGIGLVVGLSGSAFAAYLSITANATGKNPLLGSLLALAGALTLSGYLVIGRKIRPRLSLIPYIWSVYSTAAVLLIIALLLTRTPVTGYSWQAYLWLAAAGLFPQLIGHSSFNFAVRYFPATYIGIISQSETLLSSIAAYFVFAEVPSQGEIIGSLIILLGVILASIGQNRST